MHEAAAIAAAFCWSAGVVLARPLLNRLSVFRVNLLRLVAPALLFPALLVLLGLVPELGDFGWQNYAALFASAVLGIGLIDTGMHHAMRLIGLARARTLGNLSVPAAVFWGWLLLGELVNPALIWAALLTFCGATLVNVRGGAGQGVAEYGTRQFWVGVAMASVVAAIWGLDVVLIRIGIGDGHPLAANAFRMPAALAIAGAALLVRETPGDGSIRPTVRQSLRGILAGLIALGCGALLFFYAIQEIGAARAAVLSALAPIFMLLLAAVFLGERPNRRQALGVALAVLGVVLLVELA